jgi:YVTN family beta-propeller protein
MFRPLIRTALGAAVCASGIAQASSLLYVADQAGNTVLPLDTTSQTYRAPIQVGTHPLAPVASADGKRVYVQSGDDGSITVIDAQSAAIVAHIAVPGLSASVVPALLTLSPDGRRLYAVPNGSTQITIVDTTTNSVLAVVLGPANMIDPGQAIVSADGSRLIVSYQGNRTIGMIDTSTGALAAQFKVPGPNGTGISALALSRDGARLYVGDYQGSVWGYDVATQQVLGTYGVIGVPRAIAVALDNDTVYVAATGGNCLEVFKSSNYADNMSVGTQANGCTDLALSHDGRTVYVVDLDAQGQPHLEAFDVQSKFLDAVNVYGAADPAFSAQSLSSTAIHPEPGLWWNPQESGSGYTVEEQDGVLVVVASTYDANGAPKWFIASGAYDAYQSSLTGAFDATANGPCLTCAYRLPTYLPGAGGAFTIEFIASNYGVVYFGEKTTPIQKEVW